VPRSNNYVHVWRRERSRGTPSDVPDFFITDSTTLSFAARSARKKRESLGTSSRSSCRLRWFSFLNSRRNSCSVTPRTVHPQCSYQYLAILILDCRVVRRATHSLSFRQYVRVSEQIPYACVVLRSPWLSFQRFSLRPRVSLVDGGVGCRNVFPVQESGRTHDRGMGTREERRHSMQGWTSGPCVSCSVSSGSQLRLNSTGLPAGARGGWEAKTTHLWSRQPSKINAWEAAFHAVDFVLQWAKEITERENTSSFLLYLHLIRRRCMTRRCCQVQHAAAVPRCTGLARCLCSSTPRPRPSER